METKEAEQIPRKEELGAGKKSESTKGWEFEKKANLKLNFEDFEVSRKVQKSEHNQRGSQAMDFQFEVGSVSPQAESEVDGLNNGVVSVAAIKQKKRQWKLQARNREKKEVPMLGPTRVKRPMTEVFETSPEVKRRKLCNTKRHFLNLALEAKHEQRREIQSDGSLEVETPMMAKVTAKAENQPR